jgi:hypothetical protein
MKKGADAQVLLLKYFGIVETFFCFTAFCSYQLRNYVFGRASTNVETRLAFFTPLLLTRISANTRPFLFVRFAQNFRIHTAL